MILASGLGIILSLVFGCLLLALIAEVYYLLWWKKLRISTPTTGEDSHAKELFYLFCWNNSPSTSAAARRSGDPTPASPETIDVELGSSKEFLLRALAGEQDALVEAELTRLHNRFLFTIKEETKEDLESEDGRSKTSRKGSGNRSLSDLILAVDTPFISPLPSPPLLTNSATKNPGSLECYLQHGFNPLFESSVLEAELSRLRSSPPPKFKFLRDAEEKMYRRLIEEAEKMKNSGGLQEEGKDGSLIGSIVNHHSSASQVLPLASCSTSDIIKPPVLDPILAAS